METVGRRQVEPLSLKDTSIEVCLETDGNYQDFNIPKDLFSAEFTDNGDSNIEESLL